MINSPVSEPTSVAGVDEVDNKDVVPALGVNVSNNCVLVEDGVVSVGDETTATLESMIVLQEQCAIITHLSCLRISPQQTPLHPS